MSDPAYAGVKCSSCYEPASEHPTFKGNNCRCAETPGADTHLACLKCSVDWIEAQISSMTESNQGTTMMKCISGVDAMESLVPHGEAPDLSDPRSDSSRLYARASEGIDEYWRLKEVLMRKVFKERLTARYGEVTALTSWQSLHDHLRKGLRSFNNNRLTSILEQLEGLSGTLVHTWLVANPDVDMSDMYHAIPFFARQVASDKSTPHTKQDQHIFFGLRSLLPDKLHAKLLDHLRELGMSERTLTDSKAHICVRVSTTIKTARSLSQKRPSWLSRRGTVNHGRQEVSGVDIAALHILEAGKLLDLLMKERSECAQRQIKRLAGLMSGEGPMEASRGDGHTDLESGWDEWRTTFRETDRA